MTWADESGRPTERLDGAEQALAERVAALRLPAAYPTDSATVTAIETHMSWIFLTQAHAYKLKKPIRTRHFDHTTIEGRRRACETELLLNRRLAPSVYLDVVPLVAAGNAMQVETPGVAIDWLVKMRRLPADRMLDARIAARAVEPAEIDRLAEVLRPFYRAGEPAGWSGPEYRRRLLRDLEAKHDSLAHRRYGLPRDELDTLAVAQRHWLAEHVAAIEARASAVVDAHGDLRPEHVCLEPAPVVIDCLEFDRELRLLDPLSELSFLALECRRLGAAWIGQRLLERHRASEREHAGAELLAFYQSYHAVVRAAVAVWHLDDDALDESDRWRARAVEYLQIGTALLATR